MLAMIMSHQAILSAVAIALLDLAIAILHPSPEVNNLIQLLISLLKKKDGSDAPPPASSGAP